MIRLQTLDFPFTGGPYISFVIFPLALFLASSVFAQDDSERNALGAPEQVTEILIQGTTFQAPLKDVPQSTTVLTEENVQSRGALFLQDTIESVPGLSWAGGTARPRFFLIRGVGELEQYEGAPNPSVATIIDDVDTSGLGVIVPFFDIAQTEVLRGPQGLRFGSSALAGAVTMRSGDPTPYTEGRVQITGGNDELGAGGAAVGGAVPGTGGKLQLRFSAFKSDSDGFRNNVYLSRDDTNHRDDSMARLKARYEASPDLTFDWSGWMVNSDDGYDAFAIDNSFTTQSDRPGEDSLWTRASSFKITARLSPEVRLQNTVTALRANQIYSYDGDWGNNPFWAPYDPYDYYSHTDRTRRTYANELRLYNDSPTYQHGESLRWVGGVYAQRLGEDADIREYSNGDEYDSLVSDYTAKSAAAFTQVEVPLGSKTSFSPGARIEYRDTSYSDSKGSTFDPDFTMIGGAATLQRDLNDAVRGYVTASRGFKGGGFNAGPSVPADRRQYDPEYLWNFESGLKGSSLGKRLISTISVFHELRRDQQLKFAVQDNPSDPLSFTYITESAARGRSTGVEGDVNYRVFERVTLFGSGSLMHTEFTAVPAESGDLKGRAFSHAPSWQYSAGSKVDVTNQIFSRIEVTGKDRFYFDDSNSQRSDPYWLLNASAGYRFERWSLILWGRNLLDRGYAVRGFYFGDEPPDFPNKRYVQRGDPRAFGATIAYSF